MTIRWTSKRSEEGIWEKGRKRIMVLREQENVRKGDRELSYCKVNDAGRN
jgi:hypothetical protein